jgi:hypothetical protein
MTQVPLRKNQPYPSQIGYFIVTGLLHQGIFHTISIQIARSCLLDAPVAQEDIARARAISKRMHLFRPANRSVTKITAITTTRSRRVNASVLRLCVMAIFSAQLVPDLGEPVNGIGSACAFSSVYYQGDFILH